ncbi:MAG: DUF4241 domain-containing protein [Bacteroidetes bacterium]|nr:DUF4241 domain-containing protein [Bacteroidota bacterium]
MKDLSLLFDNPPEGATIIEVGDLTVPTGVLIACDPFQTCTSPPFITEVPKGQFPVQLLLVNLRVAFARVLFSTKPATAWEPALTEWGGNTHMVDAGLSCFIDQSTSERFCRLLTEYKAAHPKGNYYEDILNKEFRANATPTSRSAGDWCLHQPFREKKDTIPMFASGLGDGQYTAWWGTANNKPVTITIDFSII